MSTLTTKLDGEPDIQIQYWNTTELAKACGINRVNMSQWLSNRPNLVPALVLDLGTRRIGLWSAAQVKEIKEMRQ